jgi:hypothetical protein
MRMYWIAGLLCTVIRYSGLTASLTCLVLLWLLILIVLVGDIDGHVHTYRVSVAHSYFCVRSSLR